MSGRESETGERLDPDDLGSFPAGHVNVPAFPKPEVPSAGEDHAGGSFEHRLERCRR